MYTVSESTSGFFWAKIIGMYPYSCQAPPRLTLSEFENMLNNLVFDGRERSPKVIVFILMREPSNEEVKRITQCKHVSNFWKERSVSIVD